MEKTGNPLGLSAPEADPETRIQGQTIIWVRGGKMIPEDTGWG